MLLRTLTRISINVHLVSYFIFAEKNVPATNKNYTGRFIMFSVITNTYNKKTKGST